MYMSSKYSHFSHSAMWIPFNKQNCERQDAWEAEQLVSKEEEENQRLRNWFQSEGKKRKLTELESTLEPPSKKVCLSEE